MITKLSFLTLTLAIALLGCGADMSTIPGTRVPDTSFNRQLIQTVEAYRLAVERQDTDALILMASDKYWDDAGTVTGKDDFGYKDLRTVLTGRFKKSQNIRYSLRYMNIRKQCPEDSSGNEKCRAFVDVLIDASYSIDDARGKPARLDMRNQNQYTLEWDAEASRWKFLTGM